MSYVSAIAAMPWDWALCVGGLGGAINAVFSNNLQILPSWSVDRAGIGRHHVVRVGLVVSSTVGAVASFGLVWALRGLAALDTMQAEEVPIRLVTSCLFVGFITARGVTNEVDKVLLRRAVQNAAAAPAAHPEIAQALDHAPPYAVYKMAVALLPRRRLIPHPRLPVSPVFDKAQPQRL